MPSSTDPSQIDGLRVLAFCDYFSERPHGGVEKVALEVYRRLTLAGADVRVIGAVPGARDAVHEIAGIPTHTLTARNLARLLGSQVSVATGYRRTAKRMIEVAVPDVIHASGIHFQGSFAAARLAQSRGIPLVTTTHLGPISALSNLTRAATAAYEGTIGRYIIRSSQRLIAVSQAAATHVARLGDTPVTVVSNGVDHELFTPSPGRSDEPIEIVFVGRLIANKGPGLALSAFAALGHPSARLTFIGDGPMRTRLERSAEALDATIRFVGHQDDVASMLNAAHILLRPSQTEGQSLAILEAMAAGVCIVASDIEANRELVTPGETGLLHRTGDVVDLTATLRGLLADMGTVRALGSAGRRVALLHSWDRCATETGRILANATKGPGAG